MARGHRTPELRHGGGDAMEHAEDRRQRILDGAEAALDGGLLRRRTFALRRMLEADRVVGVVEPRVADLGCEVIETAVAEVQAAIVSSAVVTVSDAQFYAWVVEAIADISEPGKTLEDVLEVREAKSLDAARAFGFLEGAAAALNATVLELLWMMELNTDVPAPSQVMGRTDNHRKTKQNETAPEAGFHESTDVLVSDELHQVHDVVREALLLGEPRLVTAVAPVIVTHGARLNLSRLYADLEKLGRERRLAWVVDNTVHALEAIAGQARPGAASGRSCGVAWSFRSSCSSISSRAAPGASERTARRARRHDP